MAATTGTMIAMGIGAALGAEKNREAQIAQSNAMKQNKIAAKYSPWVQLPGQQVPGVNPVGDIVGGAASGASMAGMFGGGGGDVVNDIASSGAGAGTTNFSLTGPATNSAPFSLTQPADAMSKYSLMSKGLGTTPMSGSAGALGGAGKSPWFGQNGQMMTSDLNNPLSIFGLSKN